MRIIRDRPPMYEEIDRVFKLRGQSVLFSWGDRIYVPSGSIDIHPALIAHEAAHGARQLAYLSAETMDNELRIVKWWCRYLVDVPFRREEEVIGHSAEFRYLCEHAGGRNQRRRHLSIVATKLSSPLYGPVMNKATARKVLEDGYSAHP
jgi:hypothetical protein